MHNFFEDNFYISKIVACVRVPKGGTQRVHKNRPTHGLMLKLSGRSVFVFADGRSLTAQAGDVVYLPQFADYEVRPLEDGESIAVNFELQNGACAYPPFMQTPAQAGEVQQRFAVLLQAWHTQKPGYGNVCMAQLYSLICGMQKQAAKGYVPSRTKQLVLQGTAYMQERLGDVALTVADVAARLGITPEYFRKVFREVYGVSPRRYLIDQRMKKAQELLLSGEFSVSAVAAMCGYDSDGYFSGEFRRACGCAPSAYVAFIQEKADLLME